MTLQFFKTCSANKFSACFICRLFRTFLIHCALPGASPGFDKRGCALYLFCNIQHLWKIGHDYINISHDKFGTNIYKFAKSRVAIAAVSYVPRMTTRGPSRPSWLTHKTGNAWLGSWGVGGPNWTRIALEPVPCPIYRSWELSALSVGTPVSQYLPSTEYTQTTI